MLGSIITLLWSILWAD